ncbi:hypothetical protein ABL78_8462 [Leptomonas seymouri]|uniref:Uncharacterized protein n=1 Tax=Leptomonas seymouri TaxID=5684 RepID=A0A0N1IH18_LEPSE|nr:hypothetical protein ABL78_8462 [Leptomonas seymouri]|eukprot:KPI82528.1 hypothetical protein ABL78_8462 [Leptomonas seymouri]
MRCVRTTTRPTLISWAWPTPSCPQQWRNAHVVPLPVHGKPPRQPSTYPSASLTSRVPKRMVHAGLARLPHAWQPAARQHAHRRGYTTVTGGPGSPTLWSTAGRPTVV